MQSLVWKTSYVVFLPFKVHPSFLCSTRPDDQIPRAGLREFHARFTQPPQNSLIGSSPLPSPLGGGGNDNNSGVSTVISINACIRGKKARRAQN